MDNGEEDTIEIEESGGKDGNEREEIVKKEVVGVKGDTMEKEDAHIVAG